MKTRMPQGGSPEDLPLHTDPFAGAQDAAVPDPGAPRFSICTLVTRPGDYAAMRASFAAGGFDGPGTEYLYIDNAGGNRLDAYAGIGRMLARARGDYVILCHQDVVLLSDGAGALAGRLADLDARDPDWALAGNAGGIGTEGHAIRISDPYRSDQRIGELPARVDTLDENFIVVRRAAQLAPSRDLAGFHLYGTDLCAQAALRGWSAWVIDFHLRHLSEGALDESYFDMLEAFERKYAAALRPRTVFTTCLTAIIGRRWYSAWSTRLTRARKRWRRKGRGWKRRTG